MTDQEVSDYGDPDSPSMLAMRPYWARRIAEARDLIEQAGDPMVALIAVSLSIDDIGGTLSMRLERGWSPEPEIVNGLTLLQQASEIRRLRALLKEQK
jgi:hypothetical protein